MGLRRLYDRSPVWVQNLMCSAQGWLICKRRYSKSFYTELTRYECGYYRQEQELVKMLASVKEMAIYKPYLADVDWPLLMSHPGNVYAIISRFPIIGKVQVKSNTDAFTNPHFKGQEIVMRTSGTTGGGLVFSYSVEMESRQWAVWWRYRRALGITQEMWCGWFGGKSIIAHSVNKPPYWRVNRPGRQVMFSSYHMTPDTVQTYYDEIKRRGLKWIHGYPSHVARLAAYIINAGLEPLQEVRFVTTGAENMLGNQLAKIKMAFPNALVRQHYGLNEGVANISQDKDGVWRVDEDFCYVEFVPVSNDNPNVCHVVGTGFSNLAFPLIRYDTGDLATVERNEKGRVMKILSIDGRSSNVLRQPSGHDIVEASLSIVLHDFNSIVEAQFHQLSLCEIELWVVRGRDYSDKDEAMLKATLARTFENSMNCDIKYVDHVERTEAGKMKLVISNLDCN